jgi:hypothetical protein
MPAALSYEINTQALLVFPSHATKDGEISHHFEGSRRLSLPSRLVTVIPASNPSNLSNRIPTFPFPTPVSQGWLIPPLPLSEPYQRRESLSRPTVRPTVRHCHGHCHLCSLSFLPSLILFFLPLGLPKHIT